MHFVFIIIKEPEKPKGNKGESADNYPKDIAGLERMLDGTNIADTESIYYIFIVKD